MRIYRITITKHIGGELIETPIITLEKKRAAIEKMREVVAECEAQMSAEVMRYVGGDVQIFCERCNSILGDASDVIAYARVKRPLHSQKAEVIWGE